MSEIAGSRDPKLPDVLLAARQSAPPALWSTILDTLLTRDSWTASLLSSLEDRCTPRSEIGSTHRRRLLNHTNPAIKSRAEVVFGDEETTDRAEVVTTFRKAIGPQGDARAGRLLFKQRCAACIKSEKTGDQVGPDLTMLAGTSDESLLTSILDPNHAFDPKIRGVSCWAQGW